VISRGRRTPHHDRASAAGDGRVHGNQRRLTRRNATIALDRFDQSQFSYPTHDEKDLGWLHLINFVVISIIAVLAALAVPALTNH
jgi:hypothetical protein